MIDYRMSIESIKEVLLKLAEHLYLKFIVANIFLILSWSFNGEFQIILTVYSLIAIDTLTGCWAVLKLEGWPNFWSVLKGNSKFKSREFFRSPAKFVVYLLMLYVSRVVDKSLPVPFASPIMDAFLIATESISILENFAKMGYPSPTFLINKLKTIYEKKG